MRGMILKLVFLLCCCNGYSNTILIPASVTEVKIADPHYSSIKAGDTIILEPGSRGAIQFDSICGSAYKSITIMNGNGLCEISTTTCSYGISFRFCHHIILCGRGSKEHEYGIKIASVTHEGVGLGISDKSDNMDVSFMEICHTEGQGILCKTNPDCTIYQQNCSQYNFSFHNNYVHNTGCEGMYIGHTAFEGVPMTCGDISAVVLPPIIYNLTVYDNLVDSSGWDGIQISLAANVTCYKNHIYHDSQKQTDWQNNGLIIGGGASGSFYENKIAHGLGYGVNCFGNGIVDFSRNEIIMDSTNAKEAIYFSDKLADSLTRYCIDNNTIISDFFPQIKMVNEVRSVADEITNNGFAPYDETKSISYQGLKPLMLGNYKAHKHQKHNTQVADTQ